MKKTVKKKQIKRRKKVAIQTNIKREDTQQRRKFKRGKRVEAYTFGEASKGRGFPW